MNPAIKSKLDEFKARRERCPDWRPNVCTHVDARLWDDKTDAALYLKITSKHAPIAPTYDFVSASRTEHAQLEASLRVALDALAVYSDKSTYHIMDYGRNYVSNLVVEDYDSDKPIEDRAKEALERIAKILEAT